MRRLLELRDNVNPLAQMAHALRVLFHEVRVPPLLRDVGLDHLLLPPKNRRLRVKIHDLIQHLGIGRLHDLRIGDLRLLLLGEQNNDGARHIKNIEVDLDLLARIELVLLRLELQLSSQLRERALDVLLRVCELIENAAVLFMLLLIILEPIGFELNVHLPHGHGRDHVVAHDR